MKTSLCSAISKLVSLSSYRDGAICELLCSTGFKGATPLDDWLTYETGAIRVHADFWSIDATTINGTDSELTPAVIAAYLDRFHHGAYPELTS
ncbi:hypothetical protein [Pseudonocardia sp. ICBG601]|uniref:hypothetical protein n=1 Tax=Pseudonocardia sp. ICBG601 TaxID=2846759 RepID=UPI001CF62C4E|nr:hypothetical protein [Pseudonocardia sp. ICBG601]